MDSNSKKVMSVLLGASLISLEKTMKMMVKDGLDDNNLDSLILSHVTMSEIKDSFVG